MTTPLVIFVVLLLTAIAAWPLDVPNFVAVIGLVVSAFVVGLRAQ